jgi:CRISPR-associated protein Cmr2
MTQHLYIFTVGPVQSFIAQARKAQDLHAGSRILSELVRRGIESFNEEAEANDYTSQIIFPSNWENKNASLPNRFIAKVKKENEQIEALEIIGKNCKAAIHSAFAEIAENTLRKYYSNEVANQIERHLEVHWAVLLIEENYKTTYLKLESLLGAVKNVRPFEQLNNGKGEMGRKCNLDGENNALFYHGNGQNAPSMIWHNEGKTRINDFIINPGEAISAVSFLKRKYENSQKFPSVAEIALLEAIDKTKEKSGQCLADFERICKSKNGFISHCLENEEQVQLGNDLEKLNDNFDYQLVYPENVTVKNFPHDKQREYASRIANNLSRYLKDKHYVMIMFDGDKMGEWLSGNNTSHNGKELENFHQEFSKLLSKFAESVDKILEEKGKVIYSGGDDFLGMVNLHHLFPVMKELREKFHEEVNAKLQNRREGKNLTFSAGIVITHYKTPLSEVLQKVRQMEKKAKNPLMGDRNAFALAVIKHSGEIQESTYKWDADENSPNGCSNWVAIELVFKSLRSGNFSNKFITSLTRELYQLAGLELDKMTRLKTALKQEMERLINKNPDASDNAKNEMTKKVVQLYENSEGSKTQNFIHALQIADFMHRRIQNL